MAVLFLLQYIFMFQIPKLPELLLSMNDYARIREIFTGAYGVSCVCCSYLAVH